MGKPQEAAQGLSKQRSFDTSRSKDSGIDADFPVCLLKTSEIRRDSSGSNDSGCKKQASLDEIQDLYSALQDLVKTNVSTTPLSLKNQNFLSSTPIETHDSPRGSPKLDKLRADESAATIFIDVKQSKVTRPGEKNSKHKRVASAGNFETIAQKLRKSPFPNRRLSHDVEATNSDKENNNEKSERRNSRSLSSTSNDKGRPGRRDSGAESKPHKRSWKPKLFSRLRSKSSHGNTEDDLNDSCYSEGDGGDTPPLSSCERNRRSSEADMNKLHASRKANGSNKQRSCPPVRKKRTEDSLSAIFSSNVKEIDQLVAALNLEYGDDKSLTVTSNAENFHKSPESELSKLESWFEMAAAEAVLHQSRMNLDEDCEGESNIDEVDAKKQKSDIDGKTKRKSGTKRPTTVKRGHSQGRSRDERKYMRRSGSNLLNEDCDQVRLNVHRLGTMHARSTPNLRDCGVDYDVETLSHSKSPGESRRYICLDEPVSRLPKSPLFYVPDDNQLNTDDLKILKQRRLMDSELFYINDSEYKGTDENLKNVCLPSTTNKQSNNNYMDTIESSRPLSVFSVESCE